MSTCLQTDCEQAVERRLCIEKDQKIFQQPRRSEIGLEVDEKQTGCSWVEWMNKVVAKAGVTVSPHSFYVLRGRDVLIGLHVLTDCPSVRHGRLGIRPPGRVSMVEASIRRVLLQQQAAI